MITAPVATADVAPWTRRAASEARIASRSPFAVDRDRIVHCDSFRELQYKTQVQSLLAMREGSFRTRLNHVIEVAQIARSIARGLGASEALAEAVALAHDLGHPPFGHAGERALRNALQAHGRPGWNANVHSLDVVDMVEPSFIGFRGLNLTWATREGIARHSTPFDEPVSFGEFVETRWGGLECQIVDAADVLAYLSHDLDDALAGEYIVFDDAADVSSILSTLVTQAEDSWRNGHSWPDEEHDQLVRRAVVARLLGRAIADLVETTARSIDGLADPSPQGVRNAPERAVCQSPDWADLTQGLLTLLTQRYYRSPSVSESDEQAVVLVTALFDALMDRGDAIPERFRRDDQAFAAATYLASLNDYSAVAVANDLGIEVQAATSS